MYNWLKNSFLRGKKNTTLLMDPTILKHILTSESLKWEHAYVLQWKKFMIIMVVPIWKASVGCQAPPELLS